MKNIAINGSNHKSNTSEKISDIEKQLRTHDDVDFEVINHKKPND